MKNYATLIIGSLVLFLVACGGDKNSVEAKKTALANLKKQALEISINIANLEKEIKTMGGAKADKTILVSIDTIKTQVFDHYIELQGKIESESNWYYSAFLNFKTQVTKGYEYGTNEEGAETRTEYTNFLSPAYLSFGPGILWKKSDNLKVNPHPLESRTYIQMKER